MRSPAVAIPGDVSIDRAANEYFGRYPYTAFPIVDEQGRALGLLTLDALRVALARAPQYVPPGSAQAPGVPVAEVADRDPGLLVAEGAEVASLLEDPAFARVGRAAVVDASGQPVGVVSITDVQRAIRSARLRAGERSRRATV
jgi:CBS domain-containing protein